MFCFLLPFLFAEESGTINESNDATASDASESTSLESTLEDGSILVEDSRDVIQHQGSSIELDLATQNAQNLGAVLQKISGTYTRNLGGLGAYSTVSIRGASTQQTLIAINGLPLNPDGVSTVNLSELPIQAFSKLQVYRSNAPLSLQSSNIGGVINLQNNTDMTSQLEVGLGSFESLHSMALLPLAPVNGLLFGQFFRTSGNYSYYQDQATPFNTEDDTWEIRQGNHKIQGNILSVAKIHQTQLVMHSVFRNEGVPGNRNALTPNISLNSQRHFLAEQWQGNSLKFQHQIQSWAHFQREVLDDSLGELGLGTLLSTWDFYTLALRTFHQRSTSDNWLPSLGLSTRWEQAIRQTNIETGDGNSMLHRRIFVQGQFGNTAFLGDSWEWQSAIQGHILIGTEAIYSLTPKSTLLFAPTEHLRYWLTLMRGFRPPDFTELYGNRGAIIGNSQLKPEIGNTIDLGFSYQDPYELWQTQFGLFARQNHNEIIFVQNAQKQSLPMNFERTQVIGIESNQSLYLNPHWTWNQGITWMYSRNQSPITSLLGKQLPNVPQWNIFEEVQWQQKCWSISSSWIFVDGNYWDATNYQKSPPRSIFNAAIHMSHDHWKIQINANNLLNTRTQSDWIDPLQPELGTREYALEDFLGYPLPSRQFFLTLKWLPKQDSL